MELGGQLILDLASFLNISELETLAHFPYEIENLIQLLNNV